MSKKRSSVRLFMLTFCAAALSMAISSNGQDLSKDYVWKPVRIGSGGFIRGMAIDPNDSSIRYARADVDNVYRWDAASKTWIPTKIAPAFSRQINGAPTNAGGGAVAIDPDNPNIVLVAYQFTRSSDLAATYPNINLNIYRSTDGGRTFKPSNLSLGGSLTQETTGERLAFDPDNTKVVYFGSPQNGLWRSFDGGASFESVTDNGDLQATTNVDLPRVDPGCGTTKVEGHKVSKCVYVTLTGGSILASTDGGVTWQDISNGQPMDGSPGFTILDALGNLWTTNSQDSNIYRYSRSGTWTSFTTPISGITGIAIDPRNSNRIFVINGGGALARSLDGGQTWTGFGNGLTFSETQPIQWLRPSEIRPQEHYFSNGGLYFDATGQLFSPGGNDGVVSTMPDDAVNTASNPPVWKSSPGIEELVATAATIPPGDRPMLAVEDETLFSINNPDRYNADHFPVNLWAYNPQLGYNNNGLSSAQDINYIPNQPKYVAVASDNSFAGDPQKQQFSSYSSDGGVTWQVFPSIANGTNPCILWGGTIAISARAPGHEDDAPGSDNLVRLPSSNFQFGPVAPAPFYSKDGGATWTQTTSFDAVSGSTKQTPCEGDSVTSYTYMPSFWGDWVNALQQHSVIADPVTAGTFYLNLTAGGFWRSTDGGVTWSQPAGAAQLPTYTHHGKMFAEPGVSGNIWLVDGREGATAHGLYHTTDGGNTFVRNPNFDYAWALALGKHAPESSSPAIYVYGLKSGDSRWGIFQSTDDGASFHRISDYPANIFDYVTTLAASWDTFGTVYVGFTGNSFVYGTYSPVR